MKFPTLTKLNEMMIIFNALMIIVNWLFVSNLNDNVGSYLLTQWLIFITIMLNISVLIFYDQKLKFVSIIETPKKTNK